MQIKKRDGTLVPFDEMKIRQAVLKALKAVGLPAASIAKKVAKDVVETLSDVEVPDVELIQDRVETALMKRGLWQAARAYILYRDEHAKAREQLKVRKPSKKGQSVTDQALMLVQSMTNNEVSAWDRQRITTRIEEATGLSHDKAAEIAKTVEETVIATGLQTVNSAFIRELVNSVLIDKGYSEQLKDLTMFSIPKDFIDSLMHAKSEENSNIVSNTPESVAFEIASLAFKQYANNAIFSEDIKNAHTTGAIQLHDLNFPARVYCGSHSIEYIKKYGLKGLVNLNADSKPAKSASVLTGHLNTFLASMQAYYAGALGLGYINILYAPLLIGMDAKGLSQVAQELVFNGAQNAFSRGSQTLFLDFNVHTGVPKYLEHVPAIGPGGKYMWLPTGRAKSDWEPLEEGTDEEGHWILRHPVHGIALTEDKGGKQTFTQSDAGRILTYEDFKDETIAFAHALLDVWKEGDARGRVFEFPKCDFHVCAETFMDPEQYKVYEHACEVASYNGSPYFVFDRDSVSLASCCFQGGQGITYFRKTTGPDGKDGYEAVTKRIKDIYDAGESVLMRVPSNDWYSFKSFKPIKLDGDFDIYPIKVANNVLIQATADHKFASVGGDKAAIDIRPGDLLELDKLWPEWFSATPSYSDIKEIDDKWYVPVTEVGTWGEYKEHAVYCFECEDPDTPYFVMPCGIISHNCRLRTTVTDKTMLSHPEHLRTLGFQNVTINIPQAAYRAAHNGKKTLEGLLEEIDKTMDLAVKAHLQKKAFIETIMQKPGDPLWQLGKTANDGRPYVDLKDAMYIIGLIGVNDAVHYITGQEMHESAEALDRGLRITGHMYLRCKEYTQKHGLTFKLEESPAESAARRLAKCDLHFFREDALPIYKGGDEAYAYYTNSIHLSADAQVSLIERIEAQAKFNSVIEAGAITHAFIGEQRPEAGAIAELIRKAFLKTQSAQIVFSPEFTYCNKCGFQGRGILDTCPDCGSTDVIGETRVVGYFSRVKNWNDSKRFGELKARQRGIYSVSSADEEVTCK